MKSFAYAGSLLLAGITLLDSAASIADDLDRAVAAAAGKAAMAMELLASDVHATECSVHLATAAQALAQAPHDFGSATFGGGDWGAYDSQPGQIDGVLPFELFARISRSTPLDDRIRHQLEYLKTYQRTEGFWEVQGDFHARRVVPTALALHAFRVYAPAEVLAFKRAYNWMARVDASNDSEEAAFRLLGLIWADGDRSSIRDARRYLESKQRIDGGWSYGGGTPSDPRTTGVVLFAMAMAGVTPRYPRYQKGLMFLILTQRPDGGWESGIARSCYGDVTATSVSEGRLVATAYATLGLFSTMRP